MAKKHEKRLKVRDDQRNTKATVRYHFMPLRLSYIRTETTSVSDGGWWEHFYTASETVDWSNSCGVRTFSGESSRAQKRCSKQFMYNHVHSSLVYNCSDLETNQMPNSRRVAKKVVVCTHSRKLRMQSALCLVPGGMLRNHDKRYTKRRTNTQ